MIPGLLITEGEKKGFLIKFTEGEMFWIGRAKNCHFSLSDQKVSGKHCFLLRRGEKLAIKDESTNGTRLNGRKLHQESSILKYADILRIGKTHFQVTDLGKGTPDSDRFDYEACLEDIEKREQFPDEENFLYELGPYLNIEIVGTGGFSTVYKAVDQEHKKVVALKVFSDLEVIGTSFMKRFFREMEILKRLKHSSIIQIHDSGNIEKEGTTFPFLALEYFQGTNLHDYLQTYGKIPWQKVYYLIYKTAEALDYMHHLGILHRDLKPANILYNPVTSEVKIIDLGLGKCILDEERETLCITQENSCMGTPNYMPLEQWGDAKTVDERADLYALGMTAYTLLTNIIPYGNHQNPTKVYRNLVSQNLVPLEEVTTEKELPRSFAQIIQKMAAFEPSQRFPTSKKLLRALEKSPLAKYAQLP